MEEKMNNRLDYDIKQKYAYEINRIAEKLAQIEEGRIYGYPNGSQMDGSLETNVKQLRKMIAGLLLKIQNGEDGAEEEIAQLFTK